MAISISANGTSATEAWSGGGFLLTVGGVWDKATVDVQFQLGGAGPWYSFEKVFTRNLGEIVYSFPAATFRAEAKNAETAPTLTVTFTAI